MRRHDLFALGLASAIALVALVVMAAVASADPAYRGSHLAPANDVRARATPGDMDDLFLSIVPCPEDVRAAPAEELFECGRC